MGEGVSLWVEGARKSSEAGADDLAELCQAGASLTYSLGVHSGMIETLIEFVMGAVRKGGQITLPEYVALSERVREFMEELEEIPEVIRGLCKVDWTI